MSNMSYPAIFEGNIVSSRLEIELFNGLLELEYSNRKVHWTFINQFREKRAGVEPCAYLQISARLHVLFWYDKLIDNHISYHFDMEASTLKLISSHSNMKSGWKKVSVEIYRALLHKCRSQLR